MPSFRCSEAQTPENKCFCSFPFLDLDCDLKQARVSVNTFLGHFRANLIVNDFSLFSFSRYVKDVPREHTSRHRVVNFIS